MRLSKPPPEASADAMVLAVGAGADADAEATVFRLVRADAAGGDRVMAAWSREPAVGRLDGSAPGRLAGVVVLLGGVAGGVVASAAAAVVSAWRGGRERDGAEHEQHQAARHRCGTGRVTGQQRANGEAARVVDENVLSLVVELRRLARKLLGTEN